MVSVTMLSVAQIIQHRTVRWSAGHKLDSVWKDMVVTHFKVLQHFDGWPEKTMKASQNCWSLCQNIQW
jgi:hypothetical protein